MSKHVHLSRLHIMDHERKVAYFLRQNGLDIHIDVVPAKEVNGNHTREDSPPGQFSRAHEDRVRLLADRPLQVGTWSSETKKGPRRASRSHGVIFIRRGKDGLPKIFRTCKITTLRVVSEKNGHVYCVSFRGKARAVRDISYKSAHSNIQTFGMLGAKAACRGDEVAAGLLLAILRGAKYGIPHKVCEMLLKPQKDLRGLLLAELL